MPETTTIPDDLARRWKQQRVNMLRGITPAGLSSKIDMFDSGYLREFALAGEQMIERDSKLVVAVPKMIENVASRPWDVLIGEEVTDDQQAEAEEQQAVLKHFYSHLRCESAVEKHEKGGVELLISKMMSAPLFRYALAEIIWKPGSDGLSALMKYVPLWFFENTTGELRFTGVNGTVPGVALGDESDWLIAVGKSCLMKALSICYMFKRLPLTDALNYCQRFGIPGIHGETGAQPGSKDWNDFSEALRKFANEQTVVTSTGCKINILETDAANGEQVFGWIIDAMDRAMVTICTGSDLATMSRDNGTGASLQGEDADKVTTGHCTWISGLFREQLDRRVLEWHFGEGVKALAFFKLIPPQNEDTKLEMEVDNHVTEHGVALSVDDVAERYNRTHDPKAAKLRDQKQAQERVANATAANEAALARLEREESAAFIAGARRDLQPLATGLMPLVNAEGAEATRNAALALNDEITGMEEAILNGGASTAALELAFATELLRGLVSLGPPEADGEPADSQHHAANDNPYHDERGRFSSAARARSVSTRTKKDAFGMLPVDGISEADNLARGNRAMQWALKNKRGVQQFMHRPELGTIELDWGMPGKASLDYAGGYGLSHILAKHGEADARKLPAALIGGALSLSTQDPTKREINLGEYKAILVKHKQRAAWVLTGYTKL